MTDAETEAEWVKSRRIEAERIKAVRAIAEEKPNKANLAFLDPKTTKAKGWSNDPDVILADGEKVGNRALTFAIGGVVLAFLGAMGSIVSSIFNLGLAGAMFVILDYVGFAGMGLALIMAIAAIVCEIYFKKKKGRKFSLGFWSSISAIVLIAIYFVIQWLVLRFN